MLADVPASCTAYVMLSLEDSGFGPAAVLCSGKEAPEGSNTLNTHAQLEMACGCQLDASCRQHVLSNLTHKKQHVLTCLGFLQSMEAVASLALYRGFLLMTM